MTGPRMSSVRAGQRFTKGSRKARQAGPSRPRGGFGRSEVTVEQDGRLVVERMGECSRGIDPVETVVGEWQGGEEWRAGSHGMDG